MRTLLVAAGMVGSIVWAGAAWAVLDPDKELPAPTSAQELPSGEVLLKALDAGKPNPVKSGNLERPIKPKVVTPASPPVGLNLGIGIGGRPFHLDNGSDQLSHPKSGNDQPFQPKKKKVLIPQG